MFLIFYFSEKSLVNSIKFFIQTRNYITFNRALKFFKFRHIYNINWTPQGYPSELPSRLRSMKKLEDLILTYKDFPKKGIEFKDVLEILKYPDIFQELILKMSSTQFLKNAEAIISIDARGFIFGSAIALESSKPMIVARKPGKLPGHTLTKEYDLEYGKNSLSIQRNALKKFNSFVIVDDLLATGGTVNCVSSLLQDQGKEILGLITVIELKKLEGRSKFDFPVQAVISLWKKIIIKFKKEELFNIYVHQFRCDVYLISN